MSWVELCKTNSNTQPNIQKTRVSPGMKREKFVFDDLIKTSHLPKLFSKSEISLALFSLIICSQLLLILKSLSVFATDFFFALLLLIFWKAFFWPLYFFYLFFYGFHCCNMMGSFAGIFIRQLKYNKRVWKKVMFLCWSLYPPYRFFFSHLFCFAVNLFNYMIITAWKTNRIEIIAIIQ